jgi:hypothetical protein
MALLKLLAEIVLTPSEAWGNVVLLTRRLGHSDDASAELPMC